VVELFDQAAIRTNTGKYTVTFASVTITPETLPFPARAARERWRRVVPAPLA
jgi:hypothetical protein